MGSCVLGLRLVPATFTRSRSFLSYFMDKNHKTNKMVFSGERNEEILSCYCASGPSDFFLFFSFFDYLNSTFSSSCESFSSPMPLYKASSFSGVFLVLCTAPLITFLGFLTFSHYISWVFPMQLVVYASGAVRFLSLVLFVVGVFFFSH